jgi:hypothetical protein
MPTRIHPNKATTVIHLGVGLDLRKRPIVACMTSGPSKTTPSATTIEEATSHQKYESLQFCKSALIASSSAWISPGDTWDKYIDQDFASDDRRTPLISFSAPLNCELQRSQTPSSDGVRFTILSFRFSMIAV